MAKIKGTVYGDSLVSGTNLNDQFETGNGNDYVQATAGNDRYQLGYEASASYWKYGFSDSDTLDYRYAWSSAELASETDLKITVDLELGTIKKFNGATLLGTDQVSGVDSVRGTQAADTLKGRDFWHTEDFVGNGGNDTIDGRGNEDNVSYWNAFTSGIKVNMAKGTVSSSAPEIGNDTLREIEVVAGTKFADTYNATGYGGSSTNRNSFGLDWNVFAPNAGDDVITGNGQTLVTFGGVGGAITVNLSGQLSLTTKSNIVTGFVGDATSSGWSPGTISASGVYFVIGGNFDDTLIGGGSVNTIGTTAPYTLSGDVSFEAFRGGGGDDTINGKTGLDRADFRHTSPATAGVEVDLAAGIVTGDLLVGTDTLRGIESIRGTFLDDVYDARGFTLANAAGVSANRGDILVYVPVGETLASDAYNEFGVHAGHDTVIGNGATRVSFDAVFVEHLAGTSLVATFTSAARGAADFGLTDGGLGTVEFSGTYSIRGGIGNDQITGAAGYQNLQGGYGNDTLKGGDGADLLYGYNGADASALNLTTLYSDVDQLDGGAGNDLLRGDFGADKLLGGAGADTLEGGTGKDSLSGGSGPDLFRFASPLSASHADVVSDFNAAADALQLENAVFTKLAGSGTLTAAHFRANASGTASEGNDFVVYETDTGRLFYDADGSGSGAAVLLATLTDAPSVTAADIFVT